MSSVELYAGYVCESMRLYVKALRQKHGNIIFLSLVFSGVGHHAVAVPLKRDISKRLQGQLNIH